MEPPIVILVGTSHPGNAGAAAGGAANFGVQQMRFVRPRCDVRAKEALDRAVHAAPLLQQATVHDDLRSALEGTSLSVGTTARMSEARHHVSRKPEDVRDWADRLRTDGWMGRIAFVFGPEDFGLANEDVNLCDQLVTIPTADYTSLNLAHAVTVLCYEHFLVRSSERVRHERHLEPDALHALSRAWDALTEEVEDRQWRRNVAQGVFRKVVGRANPDTYEVHNLFGIFANALKRFDHPEHATAVSSRVLRERDLLVERTFGAQPGAAHEPGGTPDSMEGGDAPPASGKDDRGEAGDGSRRA